MANISWNGSAAAVGGQAITPLTELHAPDNPADFETGGSTDTTMPHGTGKDKCEVSVGFLGSHFPAPGVVVALAFQIGVTGSGETYSNANLAGAPALAFATQLTISGRKDGRIEGSGTLVPADTSLTPVPQSWTSGDVGFNGSSANFASTAFTSLVAIQYSGSCQPIDSTGADAAAPVATVYVPGIKDETVTITTLGAPQAAAKQVGALTVAWTDGGTAGTSPGGYTAECVSTNPGGAVNGQATTEHAFKFRRIAAGNS